MKKIAAIVFVPNEARYINQFLGLYYSVMLHRELVETVDFIVGCDPEIADQLDLKNVIIAHTRTISEEPEFQFKLMENRSYPFINSWSHFIDEKSVEIIRRYQYALRIDVDTFLSPNILSIKIHDTEVITGRGNYLGEGTKDRLYRVARTLDMGHRGIHNIGSTWFARSEIMIELGRSSIECVKHFLHKEFSSTGEWPEWFSGVVLLYAGELALNNSKNELTVCNQFDAHSTSNTSIYETYSVHCWHSNGFFSKFEYQSGKYNSVQTPTSYWKIPDLSLYCMRLAELHRTGSIDPVRELQQNTQNKQSISEVRMTPVQGARTALNLLRQSLPRLPRYIIVRLIDKLFRKSG